MRFSVRHQTLYRYSAPVRLAEHVLRFNPRPDAGRLLTRTLSIDPTPIVREETLDPFGNLVTRVAFDGLSARFAIDSRFEIEVVGPAAPKIAAPPPLPWPVDADGPNAAYRASDDIDDTVRAFAAGIAVENAAATRWRFSTVSTRRCSLASVTTSAPRAPRGPPRRRWRSATAPAAT